MLEGLGVFVEEGHGHGSQDEGTNGLCFMDATVSGLKVVALVEIGATHNFVIERIATSLHCMHESNMVAFKLVNSAVKLVAKSVRSAPLKVGED
jgi:hypothetical protein